MNIKTLNGEYVIGGIYQHYKGGLYKLLNIAKLHDSLDIFLIIYEHCDINGVSISIKYGKDMQYILHQPFATHENRWNDKVTVNNIEIERFKFIK